MSGAILYGTYMFILFAANILGAVGGFGAGLISIPFLTYIFDTKTVVMASTMMCILNGIISVRNWNAIEWKELWNITFGMCLGLPLGVFGLKTMNALTLKLVLGIFMIILGIYGFIRLKKSELRNYTFPKVVLWGCLIIGGIVQGAISSGGCFILLYAQQNVKDKRQFRATMALLWTVVSLITILQYSLLGTLTGDAVKLFIIGAPAVIFGILVGGRLCGKLSQTAFQYLINGIIIAAGFLNCFVVLNTG